MKASQFSEKFNFVAEQHRIAIDIDLAIIEAIRRQHGLIPGVPSDRPRYQERQVAWDEWDQEFPPPPP